MDDKQTDQTIPEVDRLTIEAEKLIKTLRMGGDFNYDWSGGNSALGEIVFLSTKTNILPGKQRNFTNIGEIYGEFQAIAMAYATIGIVDEFLNYITNTGRRYIVEYTVKRSIVGIYTIAYKLTVGLDLVVDPKQTTMDSTLEGNPNYKVSFEAKTPITTEALLDELNEDTNV